MALNPRRAPSSYDAEDQRVFRAEVEREDKNNLKRLNDAEVRTITVTGGQVVFPATQNASTGANTLDDYEEGTFTPTLGDGTNNYTLSKALGWYTKIGNRVFGEASCAWTSTGSAGAGQLKLGNLPFASSSVTNYESAGSVSYIEGFDTTASLKQVTVGIGTNATFLGFLLINDNAAPSIVVSNASSASGAVVVGFSYRV